ncbi:hypothetical protein C8Q75DRAFT_712084, partial [Abortiporus biennis]
ALFIWDYLITFDREVGYFWGERLSVVSLLFFVNRYVNLFAVIIELFLQARFNTFQVIHRSCKILTRLDEALILCSLLVIAAFVTLRIYATWTRDWRPALPVLILALAPFGSMYLYSHATPILAPKFIGGCAVRLNVSTPTFRRHVTPIPLYYPCRSCTLAYDVLVLVFTLIKTLRIRQMTLRLNTRPRLVTLLLRDGKISSTFS